MTGYTHASGFLLFNLTLHTLKALLVIGVLVRLGLSVRAAVWAGVLFGLGIGHYFKEVLWACTSGALAAVVCILAAMFIGLGSMAMPCPPTWRRILAIVSLLGLAPILHEAGLVGPFLVAGAIATRHGIRVATQVFRILVIPVCFWACALSLLSATHSSYRVAEAQLVMTPLMILRYVGFMVVPLQSSQLGLAPVLHLFAALFVGLLGRATVRDNTKPGWYLLLWVVVALAPFALVPMPPGWLELRYLYLASIPYCALLANLAIEFNGRWKLLARVGIFSVAICTVLFESGMERRWGTLGLPASGQVAFQLPSRSMPPSHSRNAAE